MPSEITGNRCLTYVQIPHLGGQWVQACVSILEAFPNNVLSTTIVLPRAFKAISPPVEVKEVIPKVIPYQYTSSIVRPALNFCFRRALAAADPRHTIAYFWPAPPVSLVRYAREQGFLTVREMINTYSGTAKRILDDAYDRLGLRPSHQVTDELVKREREELETYDFVFAASKAIESSLIDAGISPAKILRSTFGWSPTEFTSGFDDERREGFRALFIGGDAVRKGVPQLLAAWEKSGVVGELLVVGVVAEADALLKAILTPFLKVRGVRLIGFQRDLGRLYKSADVFVLPSLEEGDPLVTYQAAGCGLPIIATPMGGGNLLRDGVNGLVVQPYDVGGLAEAISTLANSSELRKRLGAQAANDARKYTYERVGQDRAKILCGLLAARFGDERKRNFSSATRKKI